MNKKHGIIGGVFLALVMLAGCSPATTPTPTSAVPKAMAPVSAPSPTQTISPEEAAWNKVVAAAKKEGRIVIYSYNMMGDVGLRVSQAFESKYGIKAEIITGGGAALAQRIMTEKRSGVMTADIMDANGLQISNIKEADATVSMDGIPVLSERGVWRIDPWANDPQKHILLHTTIYEATFANTNAIKPEDMPKSFAELAQPKWKGKIVTFDPGISSGPTTQFGTLLRRKLIDEETLRAIGKNEIVYTPNVSETSRMLLQGVYQIDIQTGSSTYSIMYASTGTVPSVRPLPMTEGTVFTNLAMSATKDSPHPNAAKLFVNWLLSREGQTVFAQAQMLTPIRNDVPDFVPPFLQIKPLRVVPVTLDDDRENTTLFRGQWLPKLWKGS